MPLNWSLFSGRPGLLRIVTLVVGGIDLGITADKYIKVSKEEFFLAMVIIMFIISVIWCILFSLEIVASTDVLKKADMAYHVIGGLLLVISAIVMLVSVFDIGNYCDNLIYRCSGHYILRIFAGFLGLINGAVYGLLGYTLYSTTSTA